MATSFSNQIISIDSCKYYDSLEDEILDDNELDKRFEIQRCVLWIKDNNFSKVALQFPDSLLRFADKIALKLQKCVTSALICILADTSYGSCCVDEVTAEHVCADSVIHYGLACLTPCTRLPVLYIFGIYPIDTQQVLREYQNLELNKTGHFILFCDVTYSHASDSLYDVLVEEYPNLIKSQVLFPGSCNEIELQTCEHDEVIISGRRLKLKVGLSLSDYSVFFIGTEGQCLTQLLMTLNKCNFYSYDPVKKVARKEGVGVNKALQKRYFAVERARDARIVGILMGTLGVSNFLDIVERLKCVAKYAGKKTYTISVGRLNPAKLANFPEIDVYVLVACPETSVIDFKEYYRPIVTPFEFELACLEEREWTGEYITNFQELMSGSRHYIPIPEKDREEPRTAVSLITGQMTSLSGDKSAEEECNGDLLPKSNLLLSNIHNQAGGFLINRSWKGLESYTGDTPVTTIQEGKQGLASSYSHERLLFNNDNKT